MASPAPCDAGYSDALATEYLRTITGKTTEDPFGYLCTPGDVDEWQNSIVRIRRAFDDAMKTMTRENLNMPKGTGQRIASWVFKSLKVPTGSFIPHGVSARICHEDIANAIDFGKRGVTLLADVHCLMAKAGATVPSPPTTRPPVKQLPGGSALWYLGLFVVGLGILAYLKPRSK
jgi:hypothetical protein